VETSGAHLTVQDTARVDTRAPMAGTAGHAQAHNGSWLLDPHDFTVAAIGGDISGSTLSSNLNGGDISILSSQGSRVAGSGDININDAVNWSANTLTLTAANDIHINAVMTPSGSAKLTLNTGTTNTAGAVADSAVAGGTVLVGLDQSGFVGRVDFGTRSGTGILRINGDNYTVINSLGADGSTTATDLQGIQGDLNGHYALGANIDASITSTWSHGFAPIGATFLSQFGGVFDGLGHTIHNLTINKYEDAGVFGYASSTAKLRNVGIQGGNFGAPGYFDPNQYSIVSTVFLGTLVGDLSGSVENSYANGATVFGQFFIGGLVGYGYGGSVIRNSHVSGGSVTGDYIFLDPNPGFTTESLWLGGLVGATYGSVINSYATTQVTGGIEVGGLIGASYGLVRDSYATGSVTNRAVGSGGLVGRLGADFDGEGQIVNSYATGMVAGPADIGGLVGEYESSKPIVNSYWNTDVAAASIGNNLGTQSVLGVGLTTAQMQYRPNTDPNPNTNPWPNYNGFNSGNLVWAIVPGQNNGMPILCGYACSMAIVKPATASTTYGTAPTITYTVVDPKAIPLF